MRLSAKRESQWSEQRHFRLDECAQPLLVGGGVAEVVRMGAGEPIVLVPGLAGGWRLLAPLARRLSKRYQVILVGYRGDLGPLASARSESVADHAGDLSNLIAHLRLERPIVVGVSFGGAVALELAAENPGRLGGLVVHGAESRFHVGLGARIARRVLERFPLPTDNEFVNQFFNLLHGGVPESSTLARFVVERIWETDQAVMASRLRALDAFDVSDRLWRIDAPTLVLAGTRDVVVPPARQKALAAGIPGARFSSIEGAGHLGFLTHGPEVTRHIGRLLRASHQARK